MTPTPAQIKAALDDLDGRYAIAEIHEKPKPRIGVEMTMESFVLIKKTLKALLTAAAKAPEGFKLVPIEPTQEMVNAAFEEKHEGSNTSKGILRAGIAAAPQPDEVG